MLNFNAEVVRDGRKLERPVNYAAGRASFRRRARRSIPPSRRSSSSIRAPATVRASAA